MVNKMAEKYWDGENWLDVFEGNETKYYLNGNLHRKDGPAYILYCNDGFVIFEEYYFNNKVHRKDGPAILHYTRDKTIRYQRYFFKGKLIILKNLPFEFPIDTDEKEFYMNLIYGDNNV